MNTCSLWKLRHKWQDVDAGMREGGAASDSVLVSLLESDPSHDWTGRAAENLQACRSAVPSPVMPGGHGRKRIDSGSLGTGTILPNSNSAHASPIPLIL